jgi:toxin ParE1/3/4
VLIRARARRDILDIAGYLEEQGGEDLAQRFLVAIRDTFETLAAYPRAGVQCEFSSLALKRVRRWPVKDFENWLVFYTPKRNGVAILHLIHGARDVEALLK